MVKKIPRAFKQNPQKSVDQNLTPLKTHAGFPRYQNFQKAFIHMT